MCTASRLDKLMGEERRTQLPARTGHIFLFQDLELRKRKNCYERFEKKVQLSKDYKEISRKKEL
jgi:hypothetical protein